MIKDRLGHEERSQLANSFIERELAAENETVKQPQRERVADFLLAHHTRTRLVFGGLPGVRWAFERMLDDRRNPDENRFVAVERVYTLLEDSRPFMPGGRVRKHVETLRSGNLLGWRSDRSVILWSTLGTFMNIGRQEKPQPYKSRQTGIRSWVNRYKKWTAAWLDFSSPLSPEVLTCLHRLEQHLDADAEVVPIAVTLLLARETPTITRDMNLAASSEATTLEKRVALVRLILSNRTYRYFELGPCWDYQSAGGVPMGVVTGRLIRRERAP